jgi:glucans biosynthesis protein
MVPLLGALARFALLAAPLLQDDASWEQLRTRAKDLAAKPFVERSVKDLPDWLAKIDYDGYRGLRFKPECMLWAGEPLPFSVQFHHRGYLFKERTPMFEIRPAPDGGEERAELRFSPAQYAYAKMEGPVPEDLGYSGFAARARAGVEGIGSEFATFQGASYFRLTPRERPYGASARGLAIDTATAKGEEFPSFVEFWLEKPAPDATRLTVYALLDSPSTTGAFRFAIAPGDATRAEVLAALFPRKKVEKLGLAPLTSMFLAGENRRRTIDDWRPEVHDSDSLLIQGGDGAWLWRPLENPPRTHQTARFALESPKGFGLLQRDRSFESYEDLESRYERRPSFWVTPRQPWGKGTVELVEIPSGGERNDNIVAYWVSDRSVGPGEELQYGYELAAFAEDPALPPLARATGVRTGTTKDGHIVVIDFVGASLDDVTDLEADVAASKGRIVNAVLQKNDVEGGRRVSFELADEAPEPFEIRVTLRDKDQPVSETVVLPWQKR